MCKLSQITHLPALFNLWVIRRCLHKNKTHKNGIQSYINDAQGFKHTCPNRPNYINPLPPNVAVISDKPKFKLILLMLS